MSIRYEMYPPVYGVEPGEIDRLRARVAELEDENAICRNAVEDAIEMVESIDSRDFDDSEDGAMRATRRKLGEAIGKATPRLMMERPEGQKFYGLAWRELRAENAKLRRTLEDVRGSMRFDVEAITAALEEGNE